MPDEQPTHLIYAGDTTKVHLGDQIVVLAQGVIYKLPLMPHIQRALDAKPTLKGFFTTPEKFTSHAKRMGVKVGTMRLPTARWVKKKGAK